MFIYELEGDFQTEDGMDLNFEYEYLIHDKEFTKEEFESICNEGLETVLDKNVFELQKYLMLNHGFKKLPIVHRFSFNGD